MRKWCITQENEYGISRFRLLMPVQEFSKNVEWFVGWAVHYGSATRREKWYGMIDGTVVHIEWLAYSPDSWCEEFSRDEGIRRLMESLKADLGRHETIVYVAGKLPDEIADLKRWRRAIEVQLPQ